MIVQAKLEVLTRNIKLTYDLIPALRKANSRSDILLSTLFQFHFILCFTKLYFCAFFAHLSHRLKVSFCDLWMSVIHYALSTMSLSSKDIF